MTAKRRNIKVDPNLLSRFHQDGESRFLAALAQPHPDDRLLAMSEASGFLAGIAAAYLACGDKETFEAIYAWMQARREEK